MSELRARSACAGLLPLRIGKLTLTEIRVDAITWVAPFRGRETHVSDAMMARISVPFPEPGRMEGDPDVRAIWCGSGQCMVLGPPVAEIDGAAMADQTDAWACVTLAGTGARDVLARVVPIDLRDQAFASGHAARTLAGHMPAILIRVEETRYDLMVSRSMARTLVHEVKRAMDTLATYS